jgi:hypothetical protein
MVNECYKIWSVSHVSVRWYMKMFHRLLNVAVLSAVAVCRQYIQKGGSSEV